MRAEEREQLAQALERLPGFEGEAGYYAQGIRACIDLIREWPAEDGEAVSPGARQWYPGPWVKP